MEGVRVGFLGVGYFVPPKILSNADLEKMVDTSDAWITTRTGIKERRIAADNVATSDLAKEAALAAIKDADLTPLDIELIIIATITPDMQFPSTACIVQDKIGAKKAACFDISAACAGYLYAIAIAEQFIKAGIYKNALVVGAEKLTAITDWSDRNTCVLFGDGAGASVMGKVEGDKGILSVYLGADGTQHDILKLPAGGSRLPASHKTVDERLHYLKMSGSELFKHAVKIMTEAGERAAKIAGLNSPQEIDCVIPHQANVRILNAVAKKIGIAEEKIYFNIERYGNMSSASTAVALAEAVIAKRVKKGDIILLDAFGSGLVWGAIIIKW
ncbi:MAG: ketoacyl-ACP synthase III [Candidatus Omnitrophica bacterium]|nr:ketoacyl-ACP synthase III [Candidatus Omnitrophota bacterium]